MDAPVLPPVGAPLPLVPQALRTDRVGDELVRAAREFETMFLSEMLAPMFESLDTEGLGGGGLGEQMFRPMLVERYAQAIAQAGGVGLADSLIQELQRLQASPAELPEETAYGAGR